MMEYAIHRFDDQAWWHTAQMKMNQMAQQGWRVISTAFEPDRPNFRVFVITLERPREETS